MLNFGKEKKRLQEDIKARTEPSLSAQRFAWHPNNFWTNDIGWAVQTCSLGVRQLSNGDSDVIGGVSLFLPQYHTTLGLDADTTIAPYPTTIGAPLHWIDERLHDESGRFASLDEFAQVVQKFVLALEERGLRELERYKTEESLLDALLQPDWLKSVKLAMTPDRRGALVTLMLAKRDGHDAAAAWAQADIDRIRALDPSGDRPARWKELRTALEHIGA